MNKQIKVTSVAHHRNGSAGESFYVVLFTEGRGAKKDSKVATVFADKGRISVFSIPELAKGNIEFAMGNSWDGPYYEDDIRDAIRQWQFDNWGWVKRGEDSEDTCDSPAGIDADGRCIKCGLPVAQESE